MRLLKKSLSRVTLVDLLRRKRMTLEKFLTDNGIVTYELLQSRCNSMGVVPPTDKEFSAAKGNPAIHEVSSPTEGIVVLEPPALISDYSGKKMPVDTEENISENSQAPEEVPGESLLTPLQNYQKKKKNKHKR